MIQHHFIRVKWLRGLDFGGVFGCRKIPAKFIEGAEGGVTGLNEPGFAVGERGGEAGFIGERTAGEDEPGEFGNGNRLDLLTELAFELEGRGLEVHFMVEEPGTDGEDAGETPVDGCEFAREVHFDRIGRMRRT